jgi:hypothetical protein
MPEFDDAVARFKAVSKRRFGYPEIAYRVARLTGRDVAVAAVAAGARLVRGLRSLLDGNR